MNAFIIGGTGLLGSASAAELIRRGHNVRSVALPPIPKNSVLPPAESKGFNDSDISVSFKRSPVDERLQSERS